MSTRCSIKGLSTRRRRPAASLLIFCFLILISFATLKCDRWHRRVSLVDDHKSVSSDEVTTLADAIPPLKDLIDRNGKVIGDISWMLDFAIIGFPKSGTSFMKDYLNQTDETFVYHREFCIKKPSDLKRFVKTYHELHVRYQQSTHNKTVKFGLKCPGVTYRSYDMEIYSKYFSNTKFIVGLRHPVSWFESFYNYQMVRNVSMPPTTSLVGKCENHQKVCSDRGRFHAALARLRKTPMTEREEIDLLFGTRYQDQFNFSQRRRGMEERNIFPNKLLLYEVRQIHQNDTAREVSSNLRDYLDLDQDLPQIMSYKQVKPRAINICDDEHVDVRRLLTEHGTDASAWIRKYLFKNPTVQIASPKSFDLLLDSWSVDPCTTNNTS